MIMSNCKHFAGSCDVYSKSHKISHLPKTNPHPKMVGKGGRMFNIHVLKLVTTSGKAFPCKR